MSAMISSLVAPTACRSTSISRGVHAFGMLIQFRAAGPAPDRLDLGHLHHEPLGDQADPIGFGERDARIEQHVDGERALVEGRQERARQEGRGDPRRSRQRAIRQAISAR